MKTESQYHYLLLFKPFGVVSQFTPEGSHRSLMDFGPFPSNVYPVGRLDADSEGLLLLTNDSHVAHRLTDPKFKHPRTYLVQIERIPKESSLEQLRDGVLIEGRLTLPATVRVIDGEPALPPRPVPIRFRKQVPTCWIEITLSEGRNRQVRKMTAAIGHPTLRLVRIKISFLSLGKLLPGEQRSLTVQETERLRTTIQLVNKH